MISELALFLFSLYLFYLWGFKKPNNFPPGPPIVPGLGSLPFLPKGEGILAFGADKIVEKFGKLVGIYFAGQPVVCVYDYKTCKELFSTDDMIGRPNTIIFQNRMLGKRLGVLFNDSEAYKHQRRYVLKVLRDFGMGKRTLETIFQEEADRLVEHILREVSAGPVQIRGIFNVTVLNILWTIVANKRYDYDDERVSNMVTLLADSAQNGWMRFLIAFPWLRYILPGLSGWTEQKKAMDDLRSMMQEVIEEHKVTFNEHNVNDFVDVYLKEIREAKDSMFTEEELLVNTMDLFTAGSETTSTTLSWALLYLCLNPGIQEKIHEEIAHTIGDSMPTLDDKKSMVYTEAFLNETLRYFSIVPFAIPHRAMKDVHVQGYTIPKGTLVYSILRYIMRDPEYWKDPEVFDPERFIATKPNGDKEIVKEERLVPFGIGKRLCLGESLAKSEMFIILVRLVQRLKLTLPENLPKPQLDDGQRGLIHGTKCFSINASIRT